MNTKINLYYVSPPLATRVFLRSLVYPTRWRDVEILFGKPAKILSEIFWEALERFWEVKRSVWDGFILSTLFKSRMELYEDDIYCKKSAMDICVGFIYVMLICIARPSGPM